MKDTNGLRKCILFHSFKNPVSEDYFVMSNSAGSDLHQKGLIKNVKAGGSLGCRTMKW